MQNTKKKQNATQIKCAKSGYIHIYNIQKKTESLTSAANLISHLNAQFKCIHWAIQTLAATS